MGNIPPIHQVLLLCRSSPLGLDPPAPEVIITFWSRVWQGFTRMRGVGMLAKGKNLVINCVFLCRRSHIQNWVLLLSGRQGAGDGLIGSSSSRKSSKRSSKSSSGPPNSC